MARAHRLMSRKVQKAPRLRVSRKHRPGNVTRRLRGLSRDRVAGGHRQRHPEWLPGVHPHSKPTVRRMAGSRHLTAEAKAKIAAALKGRKHPHPGHPLSASARAKISAAEKGKHKSGHPMSPAARAKLAAKLAGKKHPHKGHTVSAVTRAKLSAALTGKKHPGRAGTHHKGHTVTPSTRAKISQALLGKKHPHRGTPRRRKGR